MFENKGVVYILTNQAMPDFIKVGITTNLKDRLSTLDNTSVPLPFTCVYAFEVSDYKKKEKALTKTAPLGNLGITSCLAQA